METKSIREKIRAQITVERVTIAVVSIVTYSYVMRKAGYQMVKPAYASDTHVIFDRPFRGTTAVRYSN